MKRKNVKRVVMLAFAAWLGLICLIMFACSDDLDVQQIYKFDLKTMPVQKRIMVGATAEIRCELVKEGNYEDAEFFIRYFQPDGRGELRLNDGAPLIPNDRYPLEESVFRLYYTSRSSDQQTIDVYIEDNAGQVVMKTFTFQNGS